MRIRARAMGVGVMGLLGDLVDTSTVRSASATNASTVALMSGVGVGTSVELLVELEEVVQLVSKKTNVTRSPIVIWNSFIIEY